MSQIVVPPPGRYDPEDLDSLFMQPQQKGIWFVCPVCRNRVLSNLAGDGAEPCCTGPHHYDEHQMTPMVRAQ